MKQIKLNLGSGSDHKPDWTNVDIDPDTHPDLVHDLRKPLPFKDSTVSQIILQDVLEHFTKEQGLKLLQDCHRVLKKNGQLTLRVPNVLQIVDQFQGDEEVMLMFLYGDTSENGEWGAHKHGYTLDTLQKTLKSLGFKNIRVSKETTNFKATAQKSTKPTSTPNILIIVQSPDWGGAEEWLVNLVLEWNKAGVRTTIVTNSADIKKALKSPKNKIIDLPFILDISGNIKGLIKSLLLLPYAIYWYAKTISTAKQNGANSILASNFSEKLLVTWLAQPLSLPVIWFEYGPLDPVFKRNFYLPKIIYRLTKDLPSYIITISKNTRNSLINAAKISSAKLKLIYPGVKIPRSKPSRKHLLTVGHLSRLTPEKGQRLLIRAWPHVLKKLPKAKLKIAGRGPDLDYLKQLSKDLGVGDSVEFLGFIEDKPKFYKSLSTFVFPSVWDMEGFGIVQTEAMSYGLPVVAFDSGPSQEIVSQDTGSLVDSQNPQALASAIVKVLTSKNQQKLSKNAYEEAKKRFNLQTQAQQVLAVIDQAIKES